MSNISSYVNELLHSFQSTSNLQEKERIRMVFVLSDVWKLTFSFLPIFSRRTVACTIFLFFNSENQLNCAIRDTVKVFSLKD